MALNKKIFKRTGYFLQEIVRSKIVVQAILVGLISGALVVLFKISITELFLFIQNYISELSFVEKLMVFPLLTTLGGLILRNFGFQNCTGNKRKRYSICENDACKNGEYDTYQKYSCEVFCRCCWYWHRVISGT